MNSIRFEQASAELHARQLVDFPEMQPRAIAEHYVKYATLALQVLNVLNEQMGDRQGRYTPETKAFVDHCISEIRRAHYLDLGIALEWEPK